MAIEKTSIVRRPSSPPPPRVQLTLGGLLRQHKIELRGPVSVGKLNDISIPASNLPAVEMLLSRAKYFVIGSGISVNHLREMINRPDLTGIDLRGGRIIAIGRIAAIMPPLERYLQEGEVELKCRHFSKAAEALLWASALAEEKPDRDSIRAIISGKLSSHLSAIAEHLVVDRQTEEVMALFIGHADHFLIQSLLSHLTRLAAHERSLWSLEGEALKKYARKAKLTPNIINAFDHGYALEAEAELCLRLRENFPQNTEYMKHLIELSITDGDFIDARNMLKKAEEQGHLDRGMLGLSDKLRAGIVEECLAEQPKVKTQLEELFNKLKSGGLTLEQFKAVKALEIGMEYFIYRCLKLLSEKRLLAYQTICRLSELEDNGMEKKIAELKNGMFGRMINDAVGGARLVKEEETLLQDRELIQKYQAYNPHRMQIFLEQIEDILLRAQKSGRQAVNGEALKLIYKYARVEKDSRVVEDDISLEFADGAKAKIENDEDMLNLGGMLLGYSQESDVLDLSLAYSAKYPGLKGYETELLALTEMGRFVEAAARFKLLRPLLESEPAASLEQMVALKKPYHVYIADKYLARLIPAAREEATFEGKKYYLLDYDKGQVNWLFSFAIEYEKARPYVFGRLTEVLCRQAETIEGGRTSLAMLSALMSNLAQPESKLTPLADQLNAMISMVNDSIQALLTGQMLIARNVLARPLSLYLRTLSATMHFTEAGKVMEAMVTEERKQKKFSLQVARCLLGAALNYGNAGLDSKAIALHLELAELYDLASDREKKDFLSQSGYRDDILAQNYALLANLVTELEKIAKYTALAEESRPISNTTLSNLGSAYLFLKDYIKAETYVRQALAGNPEMQMSVHDLAVILIETGRAGEALELIKQFISKNQEIAPALGWVSDVLFRLISESQLAEASEIAKNHHQSYGRDQLLKLYVGFPSYLQRRFATGYPAYLGL